MAAHQRHVLMIASDDMRPEISPYGKTQVSTPNLQRLADEGALFRRAYVSVALCGPSRSALLTGRRPDSSRVWGMFYFRETTGANYTTLPQHFRQHGYRSIGIGKIFHPGVPSGGSLASGEDQDQRFGSWSVPHYMPTDEWSLRDHSYLEVNASWWQLTDGKAVVRAREWIRNASQYEEPLFLAVGFHKPHLPYIYPSSNAFKGSVHFPPDNHFLTDGVPPVASE